MSGRWGEFTAGARRGFLIGAGGGALQGALLTKNRAVFASLFGAAWGAVGALFGAVRDRASRSSLLYT